MLKESPSFYSAFSVRLLLHLFTFCKRSLLQRIVYPKANPFQIVYHLQIYQCPISQPIMGFLQLFYWGEVFSYVRNVSLCSTWILDPK